jgi:hypothetical protein
MNFQQKEISSYFFILYSIVLAFIVLIICTKSSPLYPINDWVDVNAYFTMGKGMMNGKVPYRDLFEQKGPLLYFVFGIAYLISNTTFFGVFLLEVCTFSVFLYYCHRITLLFLESKYSIVILPILACVVANMNSFSHGGSAEELCLPLLTMSLYELIKYFKIMYPKPLSNKIVFFNGVIAGAILWIKFSLLGFWFAWILSIFICIASRSYFKKAVEACFVFLGGIVVATSPWIGYFAMNKSISVWLKSYIYINIVAYPNDFSIFERISFAAIEILAYAKYNGLSGFLILFGMLFFSFYRGYINSLSCRMLLVLSFFLLSLGVYGGGRNYIYYFTIFSPFMIFGLIVLLDSIQRFIFNISLRDCIITTIFISVLIIVYCLNFNHNIYMMKMKKEELVQYKFSAIINKAKTPTMLNYGYMDFGFYEAANIIPNVKYFENLNVEYSKYPIIMDKQNEYIKNKEVDYVVVIQREPHYTPNKNIPYLFENYNLISQDSLVHEGVKYIYFLFEIKK